MMDDEIAKGLYNIDGANALQTPLENQSSSSTSKEEDAKQVKANWFSSVREKLNICTRL